MGSALEARPERRAATRYRVPARAQLFWPEAQAVPVTIRDISASGCSVIGERVPGPGARLFLSLEVSGLPNLRLPATSLRSQLEGYGQAAAIRFDVPPPSVRGLGRLLADCSQEAQPVGHVLVIDDDVRSRERVASVLRSTGLPVIAASTGVEALSRTSELCVDVVFARADAQGIEALSLLAVTAPGALRIAYGRGDAVERAMAFGYAQAVADDPTSAKCLSRLLGDRLRRALAE